MSYYTCFLLPQGRFRYTRASSDFFCAITNNIILHAQYEQSGSKLVTLRYATTKHGPPWTRENNYEAIDYIIA